MPGNAEDIHIRKITEHDFENVRALVRDSRMEIFPEGFKRAVMYSLKVQGLFFSASVLVSLVTYQNLFVVMVLHVFLLSLSRKLMYNEWKNILLAITPELDSWHIFHEMYLLKENCTFFVATVRSFEQGDREEIVGCVGLRNPDTFMGNIVGKHGLSDDTLEVKRTSIAPSHRGQGISKRLMAACEKKVLENCKLFQSDLVLDCGESQVAGVGLYRKLGYSLIQTDRFAFLHGLNSLEVYYFVKPFKLLVEN